MAENTISITVNNERKEVDASFTGVELFAEDKNIIAVRLNGELRDLYTPLHNGDTVESVALDSEDGIAIMRHSATHVMAQAVQEIRPDAKLGVGPVIKDGFYGAYITEGVTTRTLPKQYTPESIEPQVAFELLAQKRAAGPVKRKRTAAKKTATKKTAAKKTAAKKPAAKKSTAKKSTSKGE